MKHILVPTDFSDTADKALEYALQLASKSGATVFLMHVYSAISSPFIETVEVRANYNQGHEKELMSQLHELRDNVQPEFKDVQIKTVLGKSPLVSTIKDFADEKDIDLIVMGTQGASGLKKAVIGTIATRILEKTTKPLLLVPERFEWVAPSSLVFASNYHKADNSALKISCDIASLFKAHVTIVNFCEKSENLEQAKAEFDSYTDKLTEQVRYENTRCELMKADVLIESMEALHETIPYDMLVMVRRKKTLLDYIFMESFTRHMAYLIRQPLLIVPALK